MSENTDETPKPTTEQLQKIAKAQKEIIRGITPENCPYFQTGVAQQKEKNGIKIAYVDVFQILLKTLELGIQDDPVRLERPDQIAIHPITKLETYSIQIAATHFFVTEDGALCCLAGRGEATSVEDGIAGKEELSRQDIWVFIEAEDPDSGVMRLGRSIYVPYQRTRDIIKTRNENWGIQPPDELLEIINGKWGNLKQIHQKDPTLINTADAFPFHTSQEMDILNRAQCDGKNYKCGEKNHTGYSANQQASMIAYERTGATHSIRLALTEDERAGGLTMNYLENLVRAQDADAVIATSYILGVLTPPAPLPSRAAAIGWIDLNDIIKKIGWYPQTTKDRREMHGRLWDFIKYGERAHIIGKRSGPKYKDDNHNEINTTIHGAAWRVMKSETLDSEPDGVPIAIEIAVSSELTALITHPKTTQYLPMAEILGAIAGGKPSGAWARVIGVALMSFWRRNPRETLSGTMQPTRRELLSHFTAKVAPYDEILQSDKPGRVIRPYRQ